MKQGSSIMINADLKENATVRVESSLLRDTAGDDVLAREIAEWVGLPVTARICCSCFRTQSEKRTTKEDKVPLRTNIWALRKS